MSYKSMLPAEATDKDDVVIRVQNLSKVYHVYDSPQDRLKQMTIPRLNRLLGRRRASTYFREFWVLNDISFNIHRGETMGVIGSNGAGKSTLLQLICGTLYPTTGNVEVKGRVAALLELGSGFNPEFTGRENVYMNASILGLTQAEIESSYDNIIAFADIGGFVDQPVKTYSSGMLVRLAFAVIANINADVLIIDEALSVGDAVFTQKCMRFLRDFKKHGTLIFVSHDINAVTSLCKKAVFLNAGRVAKMGTAKEVAQCYIEHCYGEIQETRKLNEGFKPNSLDDKKFTQNEYRDMRTDFINQSNLRNDIQIFKFNHHDSGFGTGDAEIEAVRLLDHNEKPLSWIVGGEDVFLEVECAIHSNIDDPIVGFVLKDRLGQIVFGDNTYLSTLNDKIFCSASQTLSVSFSFRMPLLPTGDYSISSAIACGLQEKHTMLHWRDDCIIISVHSSPVSYGLIGIPMKNITMKVR